MYENYYNYWLQKLAAINGQTPTQATYTPPAPAPLPTPTPTQTPASQGLQGLALTIPGISTPASQLNPADATKTSVTPVVPQEQLAELVPQHLFDGAAPDGNTGVGEASTGDAGAAAAAAAGVGVSDTGFARGGPVLPPPKGVAKPRSKRAKH